MHPHTNVLFPKIRNVRFVTYLVVEVSWGPKALDCLLCPENDLHLEAVHFYYTLHLSRLHVILRLISPKVTLNARVRRSCLLMYFYSLYRRGGLQWRDPPQGQRRSEWHPPLIPVLPVPETPALGPLQHVHVNVYYYRQLVRYPLATMLCIQMYDTVYVVLRT